MKKGQKVLLRLLNASATDHCILSLPGHTFTVLALDGNAVPNPQPTEIVALAAAERVDAIVEMNTPGVWILGSVLPKARDMGLGIVIEYEGAIGNPAPVFLLRSVEIVSLRNRWVRIRQGRFSVEALCWDLSLKERMRGDCLIEFRGKRRILRDFRDAGAVA